MYSVTFTCEKSRTNRANLNKIKLWVNVNGERSTVNLDLRVNPEEFKKAIFSKRSNHINRYCSDIRRRIDEYYTDCTVRGLQVRAAMLTEYDVDAATAKADIDAFIDALTKAALLV